VRIALVTGASRGIGRAASIALARAGWHVIALARAQRALETLDDDIRAGAGQATLVPLDLKDGDAIDRLGATIFERWGKLDGFLGCAGVLGPLTPAHQAAPGAMQEVYSVNLHANQRLIRAMHPLLRVSDAGRAAFVTSLAARHAVAYWSPYASSKAALESLVRCYAAEVAITPIRVNLIDPGAVRTAMRAKAFPGEDPMSVKPPEDVAPAIVEMLSPDCQKNGELVQLAP
jgi:NAD(P)-dependent dehydrogenase (short-subunit alcohol dehydrogenase family)